MVQEASTPAPTIHAHLAAEPGPQREAAHSLMTAASSLVLVAARSQSIAEKASDAASQAELNNSIRTRMRNVRRSHLASTLLAATAAVSANNIGANSHPGPFGTTGQVVETVGLVAASALAARSANLQGREITRDVEAVTQPDAALYVMGTLFNAAAAKWVGLSGIDQKQATVEVTEFLFEAAAAVRQQDSTLYVPPLG